MKQSKGRGRQKRINHVHIVRSLWSIVTANTELTTTEASRWGTHRVSFLQASRHRLFVNRSIHSLVFALFHVWFLFKDDSKQYKTAKKHVIQQTTRTLAYCVRAGTEGRTSPFSASAGNMYIGRLNFSPLCTGPQPTTKVPWLLILGLQVYFSRWVYLQLQNP